MRQLTDYIKEYPNCLSDELCDEMVRRFDVDKRTYRGELRDGPPNYKQSTDLHISRLPDWKDVDNQLFEALAPKVSQYLTFLEDSFGFFEGRNIHDVGYQIQKTCVGEGYKWHSDHQIHGVRQNAFNDVIMVPQRIVTYIFYLNAVEAGGQTQFFRDETVGVTPEKGKLLLFPANPIYVHQGAPVEAGVKYIATGWVCSSYLALD